MLWGQHSILNPNMLTREDWTLDQRNWYSSCSQRACLIYRCVQDEGGDRGWNLWAICGKKAQFLSRKICYPLFRLRYVLSWRVFIKFNFKVGQKNTWVSDLIVRQLWKLSSKSEQRLHWSNSAKRRWMIYLPGMRWGCTGSLDMLE